MIQNFTWNSLEPNVPHRVAELVSWPRLDRASATTLSVSKLYRKTPRQGEISKAASLGLVPPSTKSEVS
jgi:hypothetical protein